MGEELEDVSQRGITVEESFLEVIRGRYALIRALGEGALGRTYLARDLDAGERRVAVKELLPSRMKRWKDYELFHRECEMLRSLDHPGIPRYYEHFTIEDGDAPDRLFLVQSYIEGRNLQDMLDKGYRFVEQEVRDILSQTLEVLDYLHQLNPPVIHRDIKPANLMMREDGSLVVIDFGAVRESVTAEGLGSTIVGTFGYMPPEQYAGAARAATDVFALGASAVQLLSGTPPGELFDGLHTFRLPEDLPVTIGLERVLLAMTEPEVDRRMQSAAEALEALKDEFLMIPRQTVVGRLPVPHEILPAPRPFPGFFLRDAYLGRSHLGVVMVNIIACLATLSFPIAVWMAGMVGFAVLGSFVFVCTLGMALAACARAFHDISVYRAGTYTLGEVTACLSDIGGERGAGVHLTYRYPAPGSYVYGSLATDDRAFLDLKPGDPLGVIYLPEKPEEHVMYAVPSTWSKRQENSHRRLAVEG
ncbi:serine/threonine protein kinase [Bradymonadaceae bacterium TMQ3]|nr:serine/threonine protein kinase [Bradymonadaceae bacterium TMQ3]TXC75696.1 serine/threonine protein kinase [Bradymonadales bacterium TMQ1]